MDAWLDTEEMARLAGKLAGATCGAPVSGGDPSFGGDFVGFEAEVSAAPRGLAELKRDYGATDAFVRGADGSLEFSEGAGERWAALVCGPVGQPVRLKISATAWLELIPLVDDRVLGVVVSRPLDAAVVGKVSADG